jgi:hypothetical protein
LVEDMEVTPAAEVTTAPHGRLYGTFGTITDVG